MKVHVITIGTPKLAYARSGWEEYLARLRHYHSVRTTALADKHANDAGKILAAAGQAYLVTLVINGNRVTSQELAQFIETRNQAGQEVAFVIGGPNGLPPEVIAAANWQWSFSKLTFPHDLAMVILLEALYRASTIAAGHPYHR